jgi:hypothetical protein
VLVGSSMSKIRTVLRFTQFDRVASDEKPGKVAKADVAVLSKAGVLKSLSVWGVRHTTAYAVCC